MRASADQLLEDLERVLSDLETLMQHASGEDTRGTLQRAQARIKDITAGVRGLANKARIRASETDDYVRQNPWRSLGRIAAVAFFLGMLSGRRNAAPRARR